MSPDQNFQPRHHLTSGLYKLRINPFTLAFRGDLAHLENRFHETYFASNLKTLRLIHLLAILFYGLTGIPEIVLLPEALPVLWTIRYGFVIPLFVIGIFFTYTQYYQRCWYAVSAIYILATGGGFIAMIILGPKPQVYSYYVGIIICLFFGYTFARERFVHASLAGGLVFSFYLLASFFIVDTPIDLLLQNSMYLFIANCLGMIICYFIEFTARRDFVLVHLYKEEQEKVAAANHALEARVKERTADLMASNQRLREEIKAHRILEEQKKELESYLRRAQKMESLGMLAGGVAHDLNNILSGVVSYPDLLLSEVPEDSPLRNALLTIKRSGEKASAIVQDLLTLARRGVSISKVVNLNTIINDFFQSPEFFKLQSYHPEIDFQVQLEDRLDNIMGSAVHLSKTIMNLVSNAAEAMPEGGTIRVVSENRIIDCPINGYPDIKLGRYIVISVSDTGIGIAAEEMERIFEPFYTKKVMGRSGTGLGMAVVWGTVHDHAGFIDLESELGQGSTFRLFFPATQQQIPAKIEHASFEEYMGNGETILVVDDVEEQRTIAAQILTKLGYAVTTADSGEEAVNYMQDRSADLVILDMIMDPGIDGLETYRRIVAIHPNQKVIITSGYSETERVAEMQRLGAGEYVPKPYGVEKIGTAVRNALKKTLFHGVSRSMPLTP